MEILYLMIVCSVSLAVFFLCLFIYGVKNGQFDDDISPAIRVLFDDEVEGFEKKEEKEEEKSHT